MLQDVVYLCAVPLSLINIILDENVSPFILLLLSNAEAKLFLQICLFFFLTIWDWPMSSLPLLVTEKQHLSGC